MIPAMFSERRVLKQPGPWFVVLLFALASSAIIDAEPIKKWRAPNGQRYFGDHPPPGSVLEGTVTEEPPEAAPEANAPAAAAPRVEAKPQEATPRQIASDQASLQRHKIAEGLRREWDAIQALGSVPPTAPDPVGSIASDGDPGVVAAAAYELGREKAAKDADLAAHWAAERRSHYSKMLDLWNQFDTLREAVRGAPGTSPPGWWVERIDCGGCPGKESVTKELNRP